MKLNQQFLLPMLPVPSMLVALAAFKARESPIDHQTIASAPDAAASNLLCKAHGPNASRAPPAHDAMTIVANNFLDGELAAASKSNTSDDDKHGINLRPKVAHQYSVLATR